MAGVFAIDEVQLAKSICMNWNIDLSILHWSLCIFAEQIEFYETVRGYEGVIRRIVRAAEC